jgi:WD40 repeat protein
LVARAKAEQSEKLANDEKVRAENARQRAEKSEAEAKDSEKKAVKALSDAQVAEQKALAAKLEAEARKKDVERALSMADFNTGTRLAEDHKESRGLAYLSRALRWNDENESASARLRSLLDNRNWSLPVFLPLAHQGPVLSASYSPDCTLILTVATNVAQIWDAKTGAPKGLPLRHKAVIASACFSPDGKKILTASLDSTAQIWDVATGKSLATFPHDDQLSLGRFSNSGLKVATAANLMVRVWDLESAKPVTEPVRMESPVMDLCFSPDDKALAVAAANTATLMDPATGKPLLEPLKHSGGVVCVRFSPNGKLLATGSGDTNGPARIWDAATGQPIGAPIHHKLINDKCWVNRLVFSPSGRKLATASSDHTACLWDAATGKPIGEPMVHGDEVWDVAFSPNEMLLATASADRTAAVWDTATGRQYAESLRHDGPVRTVAFCDDGRRLLTGSSDGTARVWDAIRGRPLPAVLHHDLAVAHADISANGRWVITCGMERSAHLWELATGLHLASLPHDSPLKIVQFSKDGNFAVTGSEDSARLWEVPSGKPVGQPMKHDGSIVAADFNADGSLVLTASRNQVRLWDSKTGNPVGEPMKHDRALRHACFSADGKFVLSASDDKTARLWDGRTGKPLSPPLPHDGVVTHAAISPDGKLIATASEDRSARIFSLAAGNLLTARLRHDGAVNHVSFSADSKLVATASDDKTARVWDAATGKPVTEPFRHDEQVKMAQFSPRGQILLTISREKTARVWDASSGLMISEPMAHDDLVRWGSFSGDGQYAVTTSDDKTARIWLVSYPVAAPTWLGDLAQAVGGYRISDAGGSEPVTNCWDQLAAIRSSLETTNSGTPFTQWGRWFLANRSARTTSPFSAITVEDFVARYIESGKPSYLRDALELQPNNSLALAKLARLDLPKNPEEADFYSALAARYNPRNPFVLWSRAQVLHAQSRFKEAYPIMESALALDPRNFPKFGPDGAEFNLTNREAVIKGWLPKGWEDSSAGQAVNVVYAKLNDPPPGETGLQITLGGRGRGQLLLRGPRFIGHAGERFMIQGWARSAKRSDFSITVSQFWEPNQKFVEQGVRTTEQWKAFKIPFNALNDFAAELLLTVAGESTVDIAGVVVTRE